LLDLFNLDIVIIFLLFLDRKKKDSFIHFKIVLVCTKNLFYTLKNPYNEKYLV
jgi:hypothetical protein